MEPRIINGQQTFTFTTGTVAGSINFGNFAPTNVLEFRRAQLGEFKEFHLAEMSGGWTQSLVNNGTINNTDSMRRVLRTNATTGGSALCRTPVCGLSIGAATTAINFDKKLSVFIAVARDLASDANVISRIQLKNATGLGVLGEKGIGFKILNLALWGEAYGTSLEELNLSTTITLQYDVWLEMRLLSTGAYFYVNNVLKGSITTAGKFPTGNSAGECDLVISHTNATTGVDTELMHTAPIILQEV